MIVKEFGGYLKFITVVKIKDEILIYEIILLYYCEIKGN